MDDRPNIVNVDEVPVRTLHSGPRFEVAWGTIESTGFALAAGNVAGSGPVVDKHLRAAWPDEFTPRQLSKGPRPGMYVSPSGVVLSALYVDYLHRTLPAGQWRLRMKGTYEPVVILVNGTPVGVVMAMVPPK